MITQPQPKPKLGNKLTKCDEEGKHLMNRDTSGRWQIPYQFHETLQNVCVCVCVCKRQRKRERESFFHCHAYLVLFHVEDRGKIVIHMRNILSAQWCSMLMGRAVLLLPIIHLYLI